MPKAKQFTIRWLGAGGVPTGHTTEVESKDLSEAIWEATKVTRQSVKNNPRAVNRGAYPAGFVVEVAE